MRDALRIFVAMAATVLGLACVPAAAFTEGVEEQVTTQFDLIDPEFDQASGRICWVDSTGKLWTAAVDRSTGRFIPANGKGVLVDASAQSTLDLLGITFNGPEWVPSAAGAHIAYTKFLPGQPKSPRTARLAMAREQSPGDWRVGLMAPRQARSAPYASQNEGDPLPMITYVDPLYRHYVRSVDRVASELQIPGVPTGPKSVRFVKGRDAVVFTAPVDGISQVFAWDIGSLAPRQITFDDGQKDLETVPWMWPAPEYGDELVLMTVADRNQMRFYRILPDGNGGTAWTLFAKRTWDPGATVWSPEPMTYGGASYVFTSLIPPQGEFPSEIWVTNVDKWRPRAARLTPESPLKGRTDPEIFVADDGPYIYYSRFDSTRIPGSPFCLPCSEGVFRVKVNLP